VKPGALFEPDGDQIVPTSAAVGPWRPDSLHGGAVCALLAGRLEREDFQVARLTMDLLGRVPLAPLRLVEGDRWSSRRVQRESVELWADDRMVARAEALRLPVRQVEIPDQPDNRAGSAPPADLVKTDRERAAILDQIGFPNFTSEAVVMQAGSSIPARPDLSIHWIKLMVPIVAGKPLTGIERIAVAADYGTLGFSALPFTEWSFASLDLTVQVTRPPVGPWVGVVSDPLAQRTGVGLAEAELHDVDGRIGRSTATLLIEPRERVPR
jgi:hypothetical protein